MIWIGLLLGDKHQIPNSELAIIPGGHGECIGEITTLKPDSKASDYFVVPIIVSFLDKKNE
jgi:hypothetical protein